ncbi:Protein phosphatase 2C [Penicillium taxi]|uniref:Protein phosphatase 2C n=1 Tax=Penicillium taxi TaxID=168475 RepID=UPI0025459ABE|nr:Protein phosphatase 2C [Penicillium taxi]KAJ5901686.1 Protein phosphatase 2C [Penicillium taxi]
MIETSARRATGRVWTLAASFSFIHLRRLQTYSSRAAALGEQPVGTKRPPEFHDYFVTHLPSSSLHPDTRGPTSPFHKLPRSASVPHTGDTTHPPSFQSLGYRETTVVRIPLRSAKHHYGAQTARGTRVSNEDTYQAGVIDIPAFAKRPPTSLTIRRSRNRDSSAPPPETRAAETATGDPQVFYWGVFDGHGGSECSKFLRDYLHEYIQDAAFDFELCSSLGKNQLHLANGGRIPSFIGSLPVMQEGNRQRIGEMEKLLVQQWRRLVGGYFKRFKPAKFQYYGSEDATRTDQDQVSIEELMEYAFLNADLDFVKAQASKKEYDMVQAEKPLNEDEILHSPSLRRTPQIGGPTRFKGGSTATIAMISTPTPTPYWHPAGPSTLLIAHVGDTRALLCSTINGEAVQLTSNHHPSSPIEAARLRRYATSFVTDSFGEERMSGLANTRAFGDVQSKRIGVSAEPEVRRVEMGAAEFSFLVLMSDGISGTLPDQEVVDIIKEARTPDQGAADVVRFATEVSRESDNATCLVIRLGGWERRLEGGVGSLGTKESREWRRQEATDPRRSRR